MDNTEITSMTQADRQSQAWKKLRKHMESRLQQLRIKNDANLDPVETANVRGQIKDLKNLLAWGTDPAMVANEDPAD